MEPTEDRDRSIVARLTAAGPLKWRLWMLGQTAGHVFAADNLSDALESASAKVEARLTQGVPVEWDDEEGVLVARLDRDTPSASDGSDDPRDAIWAAEAAEFGDDHDPSAYDGTSEEA